MELDSLLSQFAATSTTLPKAVIIYGPTGSGKTALSLRVAKKLQTSIINADSRQIYRGLNIGAGKIRPEEMDHIEHHLFDILDITQDYSVGQYKKDAIETMQTLCANGNIPVLCGGTGLYLDSIIRNLNISEIPPDWDLRKELEEIRQEKGNEHLWNMLAQKDPDYAKELHPNNYRYIMRGIEVLQKTGRSKSEQTEGKPLFEFLFLTPYDGDREKLYENIDRRVLGMMKNGFVNEVEELLEKGYKKKDFGMKTL